MYGGMRGIRGLVTETSLLDPEEVNDSASYQPLSSFLPSSSLSPPCLPPSLALSLSPFLQGIRFRGYSLPECQEVSVHLSVYLMKFMMSW